MRAPRTSRSLQQRGFVGKAGRGERLACEDDLRDLIRSEAWLMGVLHAARTCDPPHWAVGAGVLRSLVWGHLHHRQQRRPPADVDLAYFDSSDLRPEAERAWESCLKQLLPEITWEVKNQAAVHVWYQRRFGYALPPLQSVQDAVATWPETAAAVAVRLLRDHSLTIMALCGLADLFQLVLRRNPTRVSLKEFRRRYWA